MPTGINSEFWNLTQAAAWVVFRSADLVGRFATPNEHGWQPFMMFPSSWPIPEDSEDLDLLSNPIPKEDKDKLEQRAAIYDRMHQNLANSLRTLQGALIRGRIIATGRLDSVNGKMEIVSTDEWDTLTIEPPSAHRRDADHQKIYPWTDIRLEQTAVMELWPVDGGMKPFKQKRGSKNWDAVDTKINALLKNSLIDLAMSDRELSKRIRKLLVDEFNASKIPGDRAMRGHISKLRQDGILPLRS